MPIKITRTDSVGEVVRMAMLAPRIKKVAAAFEKKGFDLPNDFASDFVMCLAGTYDFDNPVGGLSDEDVKDIKEELFRFMMTRGAEVLAALRQVTSPAIRRAKLVDILETGLTSFIGQKDPLQAGKVTPEAKLRIANEAADEILASYSGAVPEHTKPLGLEV